MMQKETKNTPVISAYDYLAMIRGNKGKSSKYNNRKTEVDGMLFDSVLEAKRWRFLSLLQKVGAISNLERQVRCELLPSATIQVEEETKTKTKTKTRTLYHGWSYKQDFTYVYKGEEVTEDTKGMMYHGWEHVEKMFYYRYKRMIRIVKKADEPLMTNEEIIKTKVMGASRKK